MKVWYVKQFITKTINKKQGKWFRLDLFYYNWLLLTPHQQTNKWEDPKMGSIMQTTQNTIFSQSKFKTFYSGVTVWLKAKIDLEFKVQLNLH